MRLAHSKFCRKVSRRVCGPGAEASAAAASTGIHSRGADRTISDSNDTTRPRPRLGKSRHSRNDLKWILVLLLVIVIVLDLFDHEHEHEHDYEKGNGRRILIAAAV